MATWSRLKQPERCWQQELVHSTSERLATNQLFRQTPAGQEHFAMRLRTQPATKLVAIQLGHAAIANAGGALKADESRDGVATWIMHWTISYMLDHRYSVGELCSEKGFAMIEATATVASTSSGHHNHVGTKFGRPVMNIRGELTVSDDLSNPNTLRDTECRLRLIYIRTAEPVLDEDWCATHRGALRFIQNMFQASDPRNDPRQRSPR